MGSLRFGIKSTPAKEVFRLIQEVRLICMYKEVTMFANSGDEVMEWLGPAALIEHDLKCVPKGPCVNWFGLEIPIVCDPEVPSGIVKVHFE